MREYGMTNKERTTHTFKGQMSVLLEVWNVVDMITLPISLVSAGGKFIGKEVAKEVGEELGEKAVKEVAEEAVEKTVKTEVSEEIAESAARKEMVDTAEDLSQQPINKNDALENSGVLESGSNFRNRIGNPVNPIDKTYEMALNPELYANEVAKKYGINLNGSGQKISILYNPELASAGKTRAVNPNVIELGPSAFVSEEELANTIAHELNHARSFLKGGDAPEWGKGGAYPAGNALAEYIRGER